MQAAPYRGSWFAAEEVTEKSDPIANLPFCILGDKKININKK
jgi:hypothetical protein